MDWSRLDAVADELAATRAEVFGLVLLVVGGVVATWLVVQRPTARPVASAPITVASPADRSDDLGPGVAAGQTTGATPDAVSDVVVVHVTGAVANPGVVEVPGRARVADAVAAAGGGVDEEATEVLNLARLVVDGERIHVPTAQEAEDLVGTDDGPNGGGGDGSGPGAGATPASAWLPDGVLDLNRATGTDLEELPGVGPVIAQRILAWRKDRGGFEAVGQLREVAGIGEATFQKLADQVVVP